MYDNINKMSVKYGLTKQNFNFPNEKYDPSRPDRIINPHVWRTKLLSPSEKAMRPVSKFPEYKGGRGGELELGLINPPEPPTTPSTVLAPPIKPMDIKPMDESKKDFTSNSTQTFNYETSYLPPIEETPSSLGRTAIIEKDFEMSDQSIQTNFPELGFGQTTHTDFPGLKNNLGFRDIERNIDSLAQYVPPTPKLTSISRNDFGGFSSNLSFSKTNLDNYLPPKRTTKGVQTITEMDVDPFKPTMVHASTSPIKGPVSHTGTSPILFDLPNELKFYNDIITKGTKLPGIKEKGDPRKPGEKSNPIIIKSTEKEDTLAFNTGRMMGELRERLAARNEAKRQKAATKIQRAFRSRKKKAAPAPAPAPVPVPSININDVQETSTSRRSTRNVQRPESYNETVLGRKASKAKGVTKKSAQGTRKSTRVTKRPKSYKE